MQTELGEMKNFFPMCRDGTGASVEPHTVIFPILKEVSSRETRLVGTGFFITTIGHFVTAKHVIADVYDIPNGRQDGFIHALHFVTTDKYLIRHIVLPQTELEFSFAGVSITPSEGGFYEHNSKWIEFTGA